MTPILKAFTLVQVRTGIGLEGSLDDNTVMSSTSMSFASSLVYFSCPRAILQELERMGPVHLLIVYEHVVVDVGAPVEYS